MTTNVILAFPFGVVSVTLHALLLGVESRRAYSFYNSSLFLWVVGNFLWMTTELTATNPSSSVHMGPPVPIGGVSNHDINILTRTKSFLFLFGVLIQLTMYLLVYCGWAPMPEEQQEDVVTRNMATVMLFGEKSYASTNENEADDVLYLNDDNPDDGISFSDTSIDSPQHSRSKITLAFIENAYIIFWIAKDLFWSFGTGDLTKTHDVVVFCEAAAMACGFLAMAIYCFVAYLHRRNTLKLIDSLSTVSWIMANYVWMCGEFFIRYDSLEFDDTNSGDDGDTRIASSFFFCLGLLMQLYIVLSMVFHRTSKKGSVSQIEMLNMKAPMKYQTLMIAFSPQHDRGVKGEDAGDEDTVLF
mmetsp:Transcript_21092/g.47199  ORF Transcript_21092/g.47199 Transcript_21092/m.47199 type:complete len:357 (-) Transcript_21092:93-1163(-)